MQSTPSSPTLRALFIINSLEGHGAQRVFSILVQHLSFSTFADVSINLQVAILDDTPNEYKIPTNINTHRLHAQKNFFRGISRLIRLARQHKPDVMLSFLTRANISTILAARLTGCRCVISHRNNATNYWARSGFRGFPERLIVRALYPKANRVIVCSQGIAVDLSERHFIPQERITVIYNPYDISAIRRAAAEEPPCDLPKRFVVAVGRLVDDKNVSLLIRAFANSGIDEDLVVLGNGECKKQLESLALNLGVASRVHFFGFVRNPHAIMARARAFASTSNSEGFPNAAAEAMVLGLPVVMADCPSGPSELLQGTAPPGSGVVRARYGLLTPMDDQVVVEEALRLIVAPEMQKYGQLAQQRMREFAVSNIAKKYLDAIVHASAG